MLPQRFVGLRGDPLVCYSAQFSLESSASVGDQDDIEMVSSVSIDCCENSVGPIKFRLDSDRSCLRASLGSILPLIPLRSFIITPLRALINVSFSFDA